MYFLDTNIFVYSFDGRDQKKQQRARSLVGEALSTQDGIIRSQVIREFINIATRRFATPLSVDDCTRYLEQVLAPLCTVYPTIDLYRLALEVHQRWQLSFYDSLIVACALNGGCDLLYTEDLQHGLMIRDLTVKNPFVE